MEKIAHLWNVNQFMTKLNSSQIANLQIFYIQKCIKLSYGMHLTSQKFGPSVMCMYCGSLWNTVNHSVRIARGKPLSRSVRKIVESMKNSDKRIPKVRRSLGQKCLKKQMNSLILKCSVCSNSTKIPLNKPQRQKIQKPDPKNAPSLQKRKKKRTKDATAGLNLSGISNLSMESVGESPKERIVKKVRSNTNFITPTQKLKKLNINRLKNIVTQGETLQKRRSLHNFLAELC